MIRIVAGMKTFGILLASTIHTKAYPIAIQTVNVERDRHGRKSYRSR